MIKQGKILLLLLLFITASLNAQSKRKPRWINKRPVHNNYYIGIGKANKSQTDYMQVAKNNALSDMISEISVNISSNSILHQVEENYEYKEKYEAYIQLSTKENIEKYEIVDSWSNKKEYWIYYRLSKKEYLRLKRERLNKAKDISKDFFEKARSYEKEFDINNALIFYIKAFDAIDKHLGEDLSVFTFDGRVFLDNAIFQSIQDIFSRIQIIPAEETFKIFALKKENDPVVVKVKLKTKLETQNITNIPVLFSFQNSDIKKKEKVISSNNGEVLCGIANMACKGRTQTIRAELDIENYFGEDSDENILKSIIASRGTRPYGNINVEVKGLSAYIKSNEIVLGKKAERNSVSDIFKEELSNNFFSFTDDIENADILIEINTEIKEGGKFKKHNLYTVFLNTSISIKNLEKDIVILTNEIQNMKGMRVGSFEQAIQDVLVKVQTKIEKTIIPKVREINL
ncbi:MAG: LPP20 family lipoprotein [Bacteroidales bacterium]|nr:LPP20 family lipoprotein [Bacteroidales bacterium]